MHPLKAHRKAFGLTQKALADLLGVERETVARWETGRLNIGTDSLGKVAEATGIPRAVLRPDLAEIMREAAQ